jgi:hypothetical protein
MHSLQEKESLCQRLSSLPPSRTKEIYSLITEYAKLHPRSYPRQLGNKSTQAFGGKLVGEDYIYNLGQFPEELIGLIEKLLAEE